MPDASDETSASNETASKATGQPGVIETAHVIGKIIWELTGKSVGRLILTFVAVYLASFLPALLIILKALNQLLQLVHLVQEATEILLCHSRCSSTCGDPGNRHKDSQTPKVRKP